MRYLFPASIIVLALTSALAMASERRVTVTYAVNGKPATAQEALNAALKDQPVTQCKQVEAKLSKNGTSIHLAAKKAL